MPRYYFHTLHGRSFRDLEGEDMVGPTAARRGALRIMGEMLRDGADGFLDVDEFSILCTDDQGRVVVALGARRMTSDDAAERLLRMD